MPNIEATLEKIRQLSPDAQQRVLGRMRPETRRYIQDRLRQAQPFWYTALETVSKPFEWIERNITKPFAAIVTSPFTPTTDATASMLGIRRHLAEYEAADFPTFQTGFNYPSWLGGGPVTLGVKGAVEMAPWMVPGAVPFKVAGGVLRAGGLARAAQVAARAGKIVSAVEAAPARVLTKPIRAVASKYLRRQTVAMSEVPPSDEIMGFLRTNHPERVARATVPEVRGLDEAFHLKRHIEAIGDNQANVLKAQLTDVAEDSAVLLKLDQFGTMRTPAIKPKTAGDSMAWRDVFQKGEKAYDFVGEEGQLILAYRDTLLAISDGLIELAERNGIKFNKIVQAQGDDYFGAMVIGKKVEGQVIKQTPLLARLMGVRATFEKPQIFKTQAEGIAHSYMYAKPEDLIFYRAQQVYNRISGIRAGEWVKKTAGGVLKTFEERMDPEIRQQMASLLETYGTRIPTTIITGYKVTADMVKAATLGRAGARPTFGLRGVRDLANRALRGERVHSATLKAVAREFPDYVDTLARASAMPEETITGYRLLVDEMKRQTVEMKTQYIKGGKSLIAPEDKPAVMQGLKSRWAELDKYESELMADIDVTREVIANNPAAKLTEIIPRAKAAEGELAYITRGQYLKLMGKEPKASILDAHGRVRWEYALDDIATELGFDDMAKAADMNADEMLKQAIEEAATDKRHLQELRGFLREVAGEKKAAGGLVDDIEKAATASVTVSVPSVPTLESIVPVMTATARKQQLKQLAIDLKVQVKEAKDAIKAYAPVYQKARYEARNALMLEQRVTRVPGLMGRIASEVGTPGQKGYMTGEQFVDEVNKRFAPEQVNRALRAAQEAATLTRTSIAALDWSWPMIQGWPVLGRDVANWLRGKPSNVWAKSIWGMVRATRNPENLPRFMADNAELFARHPDLLTAGSEFYMGVPIMEAIVGKMPGVGKAVNKIIEETYGRMGTAFSMPGVVARAEIAKSLEVGAAKRLGVAIKELPLDALKEIDEIANKLSGAISTQQMGKGAVKRAWESATIFAPSYLRANVMLMRDLGRGGATGAEARRALSGMFGGMMLSYVGIAEALGQKPYLNPLPTQYGGDGGKFLSFDIGEGTVGIGGMWYATIRLLGSLAGAAATAPRDFLSTDVREHPAAFAVFSRLSPTAGFAREIVTGRDFMGNRLDEPGDYARIIAEKFTPIMLQDVLLGGPGGERLPLKALPAEFMGMRTWPTGKWRQLDIMRKQAIDGDPQLQGELWQNLEDGPKHDLEQKFSGLRDLRLELQKDWDMQRGSDFEKAKALVMEEKSELFSMRMDNLAIAFDQGMSMQEYNTRRGDILGEYFGSKDVIDGMRVILDKKSAAQIEEWRERDRKPSDAAMDEYREIKRTPPLDENGLEDWSAMYKTADAFLARQDPAIREYIIKYEYAWLDNLPENARVVEKARLEMVRTLRPYWDVRNQILDADSGKARRVAEDFERTARQQPNPQLWRKMMLARSPALAAYLARVEATVRRVHESMRRDPTVAAAWARWYA